MQHRIDCEQTKSLCLCRRPDNVRAEVQLLSTYHGISKKSTVPTVAATKSTPDASLMVAAAEKNYLFEFEIRNDYHEETALLSNGMRAELMQQRSRKGSTEFGRRHTRK
eukprot:SAG31_NODE_3679_length_3994_cov_3.349422_2_plen_109_part_00